MEDTVIQTPPAPEVTVEIKEFATPEEFTQYYTEHSDELGKKTTQKLNKLFRVEGYHIGRKKDELCLKKWCGYNKYYKPTPSKVNDDLAGRVARIEARLEEIAITVNELIEELNYL
jgi:hypothetical protein